MKDYAFHMERRNKTSCGELLPDVGLVSAEGRQVRLSDYRGRLNLVVILAGGMDDENLLRLLGEAAGKHADITGEEAEVILILTKDRSGRTPLGVRVDWPFVVLMDSNGHAHRLFDTLDADGTAIPAVFIADRFGEIYAEYSSKERQQLPQINEVLQWLFFINSQCPECGAPEWPQE
ncbi:MAG: redoxin domain-containing protein [Acidobacteriota bacterium]